MPALDTDLYLPTLLEFARSLGVPVAAAQFTLTAYLVGLAAGSFPVPVADRYGREPVLAGLAPC